MKTQRVVVIDVDEGYLKLRVRDEEVNFHMSEVV